MPTPAQAADLIMRLAHETGDMINSFAVEVLRTRGGRLGSGMGSLIEALWGYYMNHILMQHGDDSAECEIGWLVGHEYNDFACVLRNSPWDLLSRQGELLRIEAKSMNIGVDESKGHFDEIRIGQYDLLLVVVWKWEDIDHQRVYPKIVDQFIGSALDVTALRDALHICRGGTFVDRLSCPDGCDPATCTHHGEPLNADGKRERLEGPTSRRPSQTTSYANNFGGLVRMLKTNSPLARAEFRRIRRENQTAHDYISFIHRNFPDEEANQYTADEWRSIAAQSGVATVGLNKERLLAVIRSHIINYREILRTLP